MIRTKHQMSDVIYNAAEQMFEALVTFHTSDGRMSYAATFAAPLTTSYETAAAGLIRDARRQVREGAKLLGILRPHIKTTEPNTPRHTTMARAA